MKNLSLILASFLFFACQKESIEIPAPTPPTAPVVPTSTVKSTSLAIQLPNITPANVGTGIDSSIPGMLFFVKDGEEHLIIPPTLFNAEPLLPTIHLKKQNNEWKVMGNYPEAAMGCGRDSDFLDNSGTLVYADHGIEPSQGEWPFGNLFIVKPTSDKLAWTKISKDRSFYHSVSTGDLNNDGLMDIIALHMGTKGTWNDQLHTYIQKSDGGFEPDKNLISYDQWQGAYGAGAVLLANIMGDARPEIIRSDYRVFPEYPSKRYSFSIFSFDSKTGKYEFVKTPGVSGFATTDYGTTSMKAVDLDQDNDLDLVLAFEGNQTNGVEIWTNNGNGDLVYSNQRLIYNFNELQFREFEIADYNNDGMPDIILNGWQGKLFKGDFSKGELLLHNLIWKNNKGTFEKLSTPTVVNTGDMPTYVKAFIVDKKLRFIGIKGSNDGKLTINDIVPIF